MMAIECAANASSDKPVEWNKCTITFLNKPDSVITIGDVV